MATLIHWYQNSLPNFRGEELQSVFPIADVWGMPSWLVVTLGISIVVAGLVWFAVGSDVVRYIRIRNM
jgi:hypothetical protein